MFLPVIFGDVAFDLVETGGSEIDMGTPLELGLPLLTRKREYRLCYRHQLQGMGKMTTMCYAI